MPLRNDRWDLFFKIHFKVRGRPNEVRHVREKRADVEQISNDSCQMTVLFITGIHTVGVFVLLTRNLSDWISLLRWVYFVWFSVTNVFFTHVLPAIERTLYAFVSEHV